MWCGIFTVLNMNFERSLITWVRCVTCKSLWKFLGRIQIRHVGLKSNKIKNMIQFVLLAPESRWSFDNRFEVNWPPEPNLVLRWISKFFLFGALPSDTLKIKHTKNLKEIPSRHFLENLLEKSKHSCLYTSETHLQFTGILPIYNGRHAKFHNSKL